MTKSIIKTPYAKPSLVPVTRYNELIPAARAKKRQDYFCPDCNGKLRRRISKNGTYHFYHLGQECSGGGLESTLHLLAKEVIENEQEIWLPMCIPVYTFLLPIRKPENSYEFFSRTPSHAKGLDSHLCGKKIKLYQINYLPIEAAWLTDNMLHHSGIHTLKKKIPYDLTTVNSVRVEKWLGGIRPDLIVKIEDREHLVEIANTHFVDESKLEKIIKLDIPTIEINVKDLPEITYGAMRTFLTQPNSSSSWLHYSNSLLPEFENERIAFERRYIEEKKKEEEQLLKARQAFKEHKRQTEIRLHVQRQKASDANLTEVLKGLPKLTGSHIAIVDLCLPLRITFIQTFRFIPFCTKSLNGFM
ncbi:hypothetical protein QCB44_03095 [Thiomicrorhabdus sp. zzn3]|uniref:hypothetical protein n=1 Tax=Thiomicrorhabdus sp. zzn3 TaxID=3039775 RepID=UPI002436AEE5|nr:hypothetical protein [Thiomicrorhabdus sp. zzn3]MDG6777686.1 hypothetical protein [Thiomicrorhabdus sp. zzn3]